MALDMRAHLEQHCGPLPAKPDRYRVGELLHWCQANAPRRTRRRCGRSRSTTSAARWWIAALEPGAREAVEGARAAGFATAVWTNNAREVTAVALERFALVPALDLVVTRDEMRALKPDPDGWRVIAAHFGAHQRRRGGRRLLGGRRGRHGGRRPVRRLPAQRGGPDALEARAGRAPGRPRRAARLAPSARGRGTLSGPAWSCSSSRPARRAAAPAGPLADRMRPRTLDEVVGQEHLLGPGQRPARGDRERRAALDDPVGAAGLGQDHAGLADGPRGRRPLRRVLGGAVRREGDPPGRRRGGDRARPAGGSGPSSSSTRSTASTAPSRTPSCPTSRRARSC